MKLELLNYRGDSIEREIGNIEDIESVTIRVVTGDEIADVVYKNHDEKSFDSCGSRTRDYYDGEYEIYRVDSDENLINDEKFKNRETSYDFYDLIL